jgi:hypothetical protein
MGSNGPVQAEIRQNHGFDVGVLKFLFSGFGDCECKTKVAKSGVHRNKYSTDFMQIKLQLCI